MVALAQKQTGSKLRKGERLGGKYSLVRRLAVGGMGQIWLAKNEMTDAEVALKVLRPDTAPPTDAVGRDADLRRAHLLEIEPRFRHEAKLGAMLSHRNIVRVFDFIEEPDGSLVLVMELLRGDTLRDFIAEKGVLDATEAVAILLPLLSALQHAHEVGVVHRDLKPANIMLAVDPDGHVTPKLLDFGIAKVPLAGVQTLEGRVLGTPRYMSPEQIRSQSNIDGRSDLFTIGILLVEMLTGVSPFEAGSPSASLAAVLETQLDPDPRIDPRIWLVIQRAMAKRAYERCASADELAGSLRAALPQTDKELAATLQRAKPAPRSTRIETPDSSSQVVDVKPTTSPSVPPDEEGASLEVAGVSSPKQALRKIIAAAVLVSIVAVLGAASLMRRGADNAGETRAGGGGAGGGGASASATSGNVVPNGSDPTAAAYLGELPSVPSPSTAAAFVAASGEPQPGATSGPRKRPPAVTGGRKKPPVATTPGF